MAAPTSCANISPCAPYSYLKALKGPHSPICYSGGLEPLLLQNATIILFPTSVPMKQTVSPQILDQKTSPI